MGKNTTFSLPDKYSREMTFDPETKKLTSPVLFVYPEFGHQFDYIEKADQDSQIDQIYGEIFESGIPWDEKGYYKFPEDIEIYVKLNSVSPVVPIMDKNWKYEPGLLSCNWDETL